MSCGGNLDLYKDTLRGPFLQDSLVWGRFILGVLPFCVTIDVRVIESLLVKFILLLFG